MAGINTWIKSGKVIDILQNATTTTTGDWHFKDSPFASFQASVTGTGAVTATVVIDVSNDKVDACATPMGTITLSGTTSVADGFVTVAPWKYVRARVTAISGTGATVKVMEGV